MNKYIILAMHSIVVEILEYKSILDYRLTTPFLYSTQWASFHVGNNITQE